MKPIISAEKELLLGMSDEQVIEILRRAGLLGYQQASIDKTKNEKKEYGIS